MQHYSGTLLAICIVILPILVQGGVDNSPKKASITILVKDEVLGFTAKVTDDLTINWNPDLQFVWTYLPNKLLRRINLEKNANRTYRLDLTSYCESNAWFATVSAELPTSVQLQALGIQEDEKLYILSNVDDDNSTGTGTFDLSDGKKWTVTYTSYKSMTKTIVRHIEFNNPGDTFPVTFGMSIAVNILDPTEDDQAMIASEKSTINAKVVAWNMIKQCFFARG